MVLTYADKYYFNGISNSKYKNRAHILKVKVDKMADKLFAKKAIGSIIFHLFIFSVA